MKFKVKICRDTVSGLAAQLYLKDRNYKGLGWHILSEDIKQEYRIKATNYISQFITDQQNANKVTSKSVINKVGE